MSVLSSASAGVDTLKRNPVLFVAAFLVALVSTAVLAAQTSTSSSSPFVWSGVSFLAQFVSLFFVGGAYAMAAEGLDGETRLGTLVSGGKDNYLSLLGATVLLVLVMFGSFIVVFIVGIVAIIGAGASFGAGGFGAMLLVMGFVYLLALLPIFFLQFYGPAVVVSDDGAFDSLKRSFGLVRRNLLATLGFDVVALAVGLVGALPSVWLYATRFDAMTMTDGTYSMFSGLDAGTMATYLLSSLVFSTFVGAFFYTYQVAFYADLVGRTERGSGGDSAVTIDDRSSGTSGGSAGADGGPSGADGGFSDADS